MKKYSLHIAIISMIWLVVGTFLTAGILAQKLLFLIWAIGLLYSSYLQKNWVFTYLEVVALAGSLLAFFFFDPIYKYIILGIIWIIIMWFVFKQKLLQKEKYWVFWILWLTMLALWYASNSGWNLAFFFWFLWLGSLFMCVYSACAIHFQKDKLAIIFLVLNILFMISPSIELLRIYNG